MNECWNLGFQESNRRNDKHFDLIEKVKAQRSRCLHMARLVVSKTRSDTNVSSIINVSVSKKQKSYTLHCVWTNPSNSTNRQSTFSYKSSGYCILYYWWWDLLIIAILLGRSWCVLLASRWTWKVPSYMKSLRCLLVASFFRLWICPLISDLS